jgi:hypothetical protein
MKIDLARLEERLQALVEKSAGLLFPFGMPENDLGARLLAAMLENVKPDEEGTLWAPNLFILIAHPAQAQVFMENQSLLDELGDTIRQEGAESGLFFPTEPVIQVQPHEDIDIHDLRVLALYNLEHLSDTSSLDWKIPGDVAPPLNGYLIVSGKQVVPINSPVVNIGRGADNQLVLEDLRVSRKHAQLRVINNRYVIFDLDSTWGTFVNGQRVVECALYPGDVISLAGVQMIFSYEPSERTGETQPLHYDPP